MRKSKFKPVNIFLLIAWILGVGVIGMAQTTSWQIQWEKNGENDIYFYEIFRSTDGQSFQKIGEVYHPTVEFTDFQIQAGRLYQYKIRAVDVSFNKSEFSSPIQGAIPAISGLPAVLKLPADTTVTYNLDEFVNDPDHNDADLVWAVSGYSNLTVTIDQASRRLSIQTPSDWQGSERIKLSVIDPDGWSDVWYMTIQPRNSATNQPPQISNIPDQTIAEGQQFSQINLNQYVSDPDNSDNELTWRVTGNRDLIVTIKNNIATISAPDVNWYGQETVTFIVEDPEGLQAQDDVVFTVTPVNDPPVIQKIPDQTIKAGEQFTPIALDNYVNDVDNADDELTWRASGATNLDVTITPQRTLKVTPLDSRWSGRETLTLTVTDPNGAAATTQVVFTVLGVDNDRFYANISFKLDSDKNSLRLEWQTALPSLDVVKFGVVPDFETSQTVDSVLTTTHSVVIRDLKPEVEYNFLIQSQTENGSAYQSEVLYYRLSRLNEVNVYPIPFVAEENQDNPYIFFSNLPEGGSLVIFNLLGEPVFSKIVDGNSYAWDVKNNFGNDVQPGLYIYLVKDRNNTRIASGKLIVVR